MLVGVRPGLVLLEGVWTLWVVVTACRASGHFDIQLTSVRNPREELAGGQCCAGVRTSTGTCNQPCNTYVRICLKEDQARVTFDGMCTFGNLTSGVLGHSSFSFQDSRAGGSLVLPFDFAWTVGGASGISPVRFYR